MILLSCAVCGIEFCYAAETAFVTPTLLRIGVPMLYMSFIWGVSPLLGKNGWSLTQPYILLSQLNFNTILILQYVSYFRIVFVPRSSMKRIVQRYLVLHSKNTEADLIVCIKLHP